jgi:hypothetical protein
VTRPQLRLPSSKMASGTKRCSRPNQKIAPMRRTQCSQTRYPDPKTSPLHETGASPKWAILRDFSDVIQRKNWTTAVLLIIFGLMEPANSFLSSWPTDQGRDSVPQWFSGARLGGQVFKSYIKARGRRRFLGAKARPLAQLKISAWLLKRGAEPRFGWKRSG